jgi:hypothetical protein
MMEVDAIDAAEAPAARLAQLQNVLGVIGKRRRLVDFDSGLVPQLAAVFGAQRPGEFAARDRRQGGERNREIDVAAGQADVLDVGDRVRAHRSDATVGSRGSLRQSKHIQARQQSDDQTETGIGFWDADTNQLLSAAGHGGPLLSLLCVWLLADGQHASIA